MNVFAVCVLSMDSFSLSFSEEEDLGGPDADTLVRIANGEDADAGSDLDESNTPTEQYEYEDDMEQGNGVTHTMDKPIIISDDSDSEEEEEDPESLISTATVTLRPVRGTVKLNKFVSIIIILILKLDVDTDIIVDFFCLSWNGGSQGQHQEAFQERNRIPLSEQ